MSRFLPLKWLGASEARASLRRKVAPRWSRLLQRRGAQVVGVTGSHGKTTTVALLGKMLGRLASTKVGVDFNQLNAVAKTVARSRPWHRFVVQEVSFWQKGSVEQAARVLAPSVAVLTAIANDHRKEVGGDRRQLANEKEKLLEALPPSGLAVLNADDPLLMAMASRCACRVVTFGTSPDADLRLIETSGQWPERLTLRVAYRGEESLIRTRFVGKLSSLSVLAALLTALELGADRRVSEEAIESFEPFFNRMSVHRGRSGEWYVMDAYKASVTGIEPGLEFLADARTPRKTVVLGTMSDYSGDARGAYQKAVRKALSVADRIFLVGPHAMRARRLATGDLAGRMFMDEDSSRLVPRLLADVIPGEVIYVKGSARVDRLSPLFEPAFAEPTGIKRKLR